MKEVNMGSMEKGKIYVFVQTENYSNTRLRIFDRHDTKTIDALKPVSKGYITKDALNIVHAWGSKRLGMGMDYKLFRDYINKRNLEVRLE